MLLKLKILFVMAAVALFSAVAGAVSFTASLDRDTITLGEQATLSLKFDGVQPSDAPGIPGIDGLQFQYVGPSSSFSFINGQTSSSITYSYTVTAQRAGEFTIPALTADVNGQQLATAPLMLTVAKPAAPTANAINSGDQVAFIRLILPQKRVYVGQMLTAQLQIYLRDDVQNYGQPQFAGTPADGLTIGKSGGGRQSQTQIGSHIYRVLPISLALTAVKSGRLTLGPFTANMVVVLPSQNQGGDPFFRMFNQGEQRQVPLATEQVSVESLPLPEQGRPADFTGAVGNFTMTATAGPTTLTAGDPLTVRVQISGRGALDAIQLPDQSALNNFKIFPPTAKTEITDPLGLQGQKTFEEIVTPQNADVHEWPPFSFSFFNPDDGKYHTLTQAAVPLTVKAAGTSPMPVIAANKNSPPENQAPQDILPIKENLGTLSQNKTPLVAQPVFLATQSLPVLAFLAAFIWRKRTDNLANNPRLRRQRAVAQLIAGGLDDLKKYSAANQPDEFFATLFRLLQEQLGERLDCPASAITENVIEEHPVLRGAAKETLDGLRELFQLCNQARYAPVRGTSELYSVAEKFEKTVGELQEVKV
jgi:hypothetical protein